MYLDFCNVSAEFCELYTTSWSVEQDTKTLERYIQFNRDCAII